MNCQIVYLALCALCLLFLYLSFVLNCSIKKTRISFFNSFEEYGNIAEITGKSTAC